MSETAGDAMRVEDGKNAQMITCRRCNEKILLKNVGVLTEKEVDLPLSKDGETDKEGRFWAVNGMFAFENIGVSHTAGDVKYLTCANCEAEVIGVWHFKEGQTMLLSTSRVVYKDDDKAHTAHVSDAMLNFAKGTLQG